MIDPTPSLSPLANKVSTSQIERSDDQIGETVTIEDIIRSWGESDSHADLNADGIVDVNDLLLVLEQQSNNSPIISSLADVPKAVAGGLDSLGDLLIDALGINGESKSVEQTVDVGVSALDAGKAITGLEPADVDQAMKTAKGLMDRWQARGWTTSPPPGFEQLLETLPLEPNIRSVVASLIEASYAS